MAGKEQKNETIGLQNQSMYSAKQLKVDLVSLRDLIRQPPMPTTIAFHSQSMKIRCGCLIGSLRKSNLRTNNMERITREDLRNMAMDETRTFDLPNAQQCDNGKSTAYQMQNLLGCKFSVQTDYSKNQLTITKNAI